jgi:hypothetical protein
MMGNNEARKMRKTGERFPTPNQRIARGIHAIGEIGRRIWIIGFRVAKTPLNQPIKRPNGMARAAASKKPAPTRRREEAI